MTVREFYEYCKERNMLDFNMVRETTDGLANTIEVTEIIDRLVWWDNNKTVYISDCEY